MKKKSLGINFLWNSIGSFTFLFSQWLLSLIVIRVSNNLTNAGVLSLAISITNIFQNIACFNVRPYMVSDNINEYEVEDYLTFRIITIILSFCLCFVYILLFGYTTKKLIIIMLYMLFRIGDAIIDLFHGFEQRKSRMDIGGFSLFCRGILSVISFYLGLKIFNDLIIAIIIMNLTTYIFIFLYDLPMVKKFEKLKINFDKKRIINLFCRFLPLAIGTVLGIMATSIPRQIFEKISGTAALGIYATVATPAVIAQIAASYIYNPLLVDFSKYKKDGNKNKFVKLFVNTNLIILIISIVCYVFSLFLSRPVLNLLYGEKIASYSYLFSIIILYTALTGFQWFFHNILIIFRKIKTLLFVNLSSFIVCLLTATLFIKKFDINGVTYTLILITAVMIIEMIIVIIKNINLINKKVLVGGEGK